jgi:predicted esterase
MREHHLRVPRTARYYVAGEPTAASRDIWFVCHGYGQLARLFLRHFEPLAVGDRVVVAPEALNRFYLEDPEGGHKNARVGATWMTREDRSAEIADYVGYLDAVYDDILAATAPTSPRIIVLGFSQGVATACRWAVTGRVQPARLVLWAERLPHDLDVRAHKERLRAIGVTIVVGLDDGWVSREAVAEHEALLAAEGIPVSVITFQGGHRMDADTLRVLAES